MKTLSPLLFCLLPFIAFAQNKVFYNHLNEAVDSTAPFSYYQIADKQANGLTLVKRFSSADSLIFQGLFSRFQEKSQTNIKEGEHKYYRRDGVFHYTENYQDNQLHGESRTYYPGGTLKRIEVYERNNFVRGECFNEDGSTRPFTRFQQVPTFPGGEAGLLSFLTENLKYPEPARQKGIEGTVILTFVVDKEGQVIEVKIVRDIGEGCGEEAQRLVKAMPRWTPGYSDDRPVKVLYNLPLKFKLEGRKKKKRKKG